MQNNFSWDLDYPYIAHYGVPHGHGPNGGSGRYPWGSGEKWRKIRAGVKNAGDKIKKFFGGKDRVEVSAQKLTSSDSNGDKAPITTAPKTETPTEPAKPDKKTALESGSREEILKVFQESSNEEIQRAINKAQLMDSLNKSIADAKPKQPETKSPEQMAKEERADYIKEALGSGDYNRIMEVATDKSVSNQDLQNALNKMNTIQSAQEKNSASAKFFENADRFKNAVDKTLGYYDTAANVWNTIAVNYNNTADVKAGKSQPLGLLLTVPKNNNQQKQNNQNNQQQNQNNQKQQNQNNNNNNQQQVQQNQNNQKQQQNQNNQKQQQNPQPQQPVQTQQKQQTQAAPKQETKKESNYEDMDWFTDNVVSQKARDSFYRATQKKMSDDNSANKKTNSDGWTVDEKNYKNFNEAYSKVSTLLLTDNLTINRDDLFRDLKHSSLGDEIFEFVAHYGRGQISYS